MNDLQVEAEVDPDEACDQKEIEDAQNQIHGDGLETDDGEIIAHEELVAEQESRSDRCEKDEDAGLVNADTQDIAGEIGDEKIEDDAGYKEVRDALEGEGVEDNVGDDETGNETGDDELLMEEEDEVGDDDEDDDEEDTVQLQSSRDRYKVALIVAYYLHSEGSITKAEQVWHVFCCCAASV